MALNLNQILNSSLAGRFILAGIVNTLFGWTIFSTLIILGMNVKVSLFSGMVFGILFNYMTIGGYAFKKFSKLIFFKFILSNIFIYFLNILMLSLVQKKIEEVILGQFLLLPLLATISFIIMKKVVFKG